jgi:hypothetical protein
LRDSILGGADLCINIKFSKGRFDFCMFCETVVMTAFEAVVRAGRNRTEGNASEEA